MLFALLYRHAFAKRVELGLSELEIFDAKINIGHHLVSVGVGVLSMLMAVLAPLELAPISPMVYALMGPLHWVLRVPIRQAARGPGRGARERRRSGDSVVPAAAAGRHACRLTGH